MHAFFDSDNPFWSWLLRTSAQASVLILLVLACQWFFRKKLPSRWRFALWWLVLARLAIPASPESGLSVFNLIRLSPQTEPAVAANAIVLLAPVWPRSHWETNWAKQPLLYPVNPPRGLDSERSLAQANSRSIAVPPFTQRKESWWRNDWATVPLLFSLLPAVWFAGALLLCGRAVWDHVRLVRRLRLCRVVNDSVLLDLLEECKRSVGITTSLTIVATNWVKSPALYGIVRPWLLLPEGLIENFSREELRHVFLHELSHVKRHDIAVNWLVLTLQVLHWFNPLVWLAFSRMRFDRELACDALAMSCAAPGESKAYGQTIIKLLEGFARPSSWPGLVGILEDKSQMKRRITMIARFTKNPRWSVRALLLLLALGLVTLTDARSKKPEAVVPSSTPRPVAIEPQGVHTNFVFSSENPESKPLHTRWFKIDPSTLARAVEKALGTNHATTSVPATPRSPTNSLVSNLRAFLNMIGVDLKPPKAIYFKDHLGTLMVQATLQDLDVVEKTIQMLTIAPPQVVIEVEVQWCEVDEKTSRELDRLLRSGTTNAAKAGASSDQQGALPPAASTNSWKEILTESRFRLVRRALEQQAGTVVVSPPKVTTVSGRPVEIRFRMSGPDRNPKDAPLNAKGQPVAPLLEPSSMIYVFSDVAADGYTISLKVMAPINEFIGYDLDGAPMVWATGGPFATQPPISAQSTTPLPVFRVHHVLTDAVVWDGQTLVLGGLTSSGAMVAKAKSPILGDLPHSGRGVRSESVVSPKKNLLLFITATIIDPAGNRIHTLEELPFRESAVPPQK